MALPFAAPPDIPPDRASALQTAFKIMCADAAFLEEARRLGIDVSPVTGEHILGLLARSTATPGDVIMRYNIMAERK